MRPDSDNGEGISACISFSKISSYFSGVTLFRRDLMFFCLNSSSGFSEINFPRCKVISKLIHTSSKNLHTMLKGLLIQENWTVNAKCSCSALRKCWSVWGAFLGYWFGFNNIYIFTQALLKSSLFRLLLVNMFFMRLGATSSVNWAQEQEQMVQVSKLNSSADTTEASTITDCLRVLS